MDRRTDGRKELKKEPFLQQYSMFCLKVYKERASLALRMLCRAKGIACDVAIAIVLCFFAVYVCA